MCPAPGSRRHPCTRSVPRLTRLPLPPLAACALAACRLPLPPPACRCRLPLAAAAARLPLLLAACRCRHPLTAAACRLPVGCRCCWPLAACRLPVPLGCCRSPALGAASLPVSDPRFLGGARGRVVDTHSVVQCLAGQAARQCVGVRRARSQRSAFARCGGSESDASVAGRSTRRRWARSSRAGDKRLRFEIAAAQRSPA
jgi:hypothetical protein